MPELPDVECYIQALEPRIVGHPLAGIRIGNPFLLRTALPPVSEAVGRPVTRVSRLGKRIVISLYDDLHLVLHLMIAGRLHWHEREVLLANRNRLAALDFEHGSLLLTEAGTKRRAALHVVSGSQALRAHDPGGLEVLEAELPAFQRVLQRENHTLKRALTDPRLFSGIGNAYSDEILHRARLSPVRLTSRLSEEEVARLYHAVRAVLLEWTDRLIRETGAGFPEKVTAFRPEMAVHGRYGQPCPDCGNPVQRISYAENEVNYCAVCQNEGRVLADRGLSRLLREDWPRTLTELEERGILKRPPAP